MKAGGGERRACRSQHAHSGAMTRLMPRYRNILITGGGGFVGSNLALSLKRHDPVEGGAADRRARAAARGLPDGGVFVLTVPPAAYRCPPGPYERICQVAWYLKATKPKSKLIVLDANPNVVSKTALFRTAWQAYPNIEYRASSKVVKVDAGAREVTTDLGDRVKYDVVNLIPPQRAGAITVQADLVAADKRWCEVSHVTYESAKARGVHVIGDATTGLPVPKSGNVANAMGKICASAVVHLLAGREPPAMAPGNTCYSWVSDREAIAVVNAYKIDNGKVVRIPAPDPPRLGHNGRPPRGYLCLRHDEGDAQLAWTGERYVPEIQGNIALEHLHRYALACELAAGKSALDLACGEGYGSAMLAEVAQYVVGVDSSREVILHASRNTRNPTLSSK